MSPNNPQAVGFEAQMEAKLSSMGFKPPQASPAAKQFARLNMATSDNTAGSDYLTPQAAADNAANTLAQQRARLNKSAAHRISAPGTLSAHYNNGSGEPKSAGLWTQNEVNERRSPSPSGQRPKSTGSDFSGVNNNNNNSAMRSPNPNQGNILDDSFSPMVGNWASQVNTPLVPMFTDHDHHSSSNADMSNANAKLASWGAQHQNAGNVANSKDVTVVQLDDAKKFRRSGRVGPSDSNNLAAPMQGTGSGVAGSSGPRRVPSNVGFGQPPASPSASSQQAALSAQANWRNTNGLSPNLGGGHLSAGGMNLNTGNMTPQEITNALMQQQSMMQAQLQLQQNLLMMNGLMSPNMGSAQGFNPLSPLMSSGSQGHWGSSSNNNNKTRSPRPGGASSATHGNRTPSSSTHVPGSGANPDEQVDLALLKDIPAWLRSLRLHKYTPTFEKYKWEDMIKMDDAALEQAGVSALGARRKLLKGLPKLSCCWRSLASC